MTSPFRHQQIKTAGVVVGLDLVGDALIKLPFARALKAAFPGVEIHWITSKGPTAFNGPLRNLTRGIVDIVHETPEWLISGAAPGSGGIHFDLLIDTRNNWREARILKRKAYHELFLASAARWFFSDLRPSFFKSHPKHLVDRLLLFVELAAGYVPATTGKLVVSEPWLAKARKILPEGSVYVGLAPGAGNPDKIWPLERFVELARLQAAEGRTPVFILGPREENWCEELRMAVPSAIFPLQGSKMWETNEIKVEQTLAIGSILKIAVANDSGTGHMLAAADCPLISLFGPTSPEKLAPYTPYGFVIASTRFGTKNIASIPVDAVNKMVNSVLKNLGAG